MNYLPTTGDSIFTVILRLDVGFGFSGDACKAEIVLDELLVDKAEPFFFLAGGSIRDHSPFGKNCTSSQSVHFFKISSNRLE